MKYIGIISILCMFPIIINAEFADCEIDSVSIDEFVTVILHRDFSHAIRLMRDGMVNLHDAPANVEGITPLMAALKGGHYVLIKRLLECGVYVNQRDRQGRTALFYINYLSGGDEIIGFVKLLRSYGADVNIYDNHGMSPLWFVVSPFGYEDNEYVFELTRLFLNYGADISHRDEHGRTIVEYARESKVKDIITVASLFVDAVKQNDVAMVRSLLKIEPYIIGVKYRNKTCIELAYSLGYDAIADEIKRIFAHIVATSHN